jgi:hypothetical protein
LKLNFFFCEYNIFSTKSKRILKIFTRVGERKIKEKMKKKKLSLVVVLFFSVAIFSFSQSLAPESGCEAGGPGSTGCSTTTTMGGTVLGSGGTTSTTRSVTCGAGYYACCNGNAIGGTANCVEN